MNSLGKTLAEKLLSIPEQNDMVDYKFMCFNGKPMFMQLIQDRHGPGKRLQYYDMNMKFMDVERSDFKCRQDLKSKDILPTQFNLMKEYAEKLSEPFRFVRVDFYEVGDTVYLGEMTFTPAANRFTFKNPRMSVEFGNMLRL